VTEQCRAEATAIIRRSGAWTVYLGRGGLLERFYLRRGDDPALEHRLGMLATCMGSLLTSALEDAGIPSHGMRVVLRCPREPPITSQPGIAVRVRAQLSVECETDAEAILRRYETRVRHDPLFVQLTQGFRAVDVSVKAHSSIQIRIS
jgi:hypothetical protein